MYLKMTGNIVSGIIPDIVNGISIEKRYPANYISSLTKVSDDTIVQVGFRLIDGVFIEISQEETPITDVIEPTLTVAQTIAKLERQIADLQLVIDTMLTGGTE